MQTHEGLFTSSNLGPSAPNTAEQGLGPRVELVNKPSCDCIGVGSLAVSGIRDLGHNIWGLVWDPRNLQDPIRRVSRMVSALNFFHLLHIFSESSKLYCTCRNSNLYWVSIGLGSRAGGPSTRGLEETSLAPAWRTGSSSVRRTEVLVCIEDGVLICKEGRLPALQVTFCFVSAAARNVCVLLCLCCLCICVCCWVLVNHLYCLCLGVYWGHNGGDRNHCPVS